LKSYFLNIVVPLSEAAAAPANSTPNIAMPNIVEENWSNSRHLEQL
jgi:hypothetical protein